MEKFLLISILTAFYSLSTTQVYAQKKGQELIDSLLSVAKIAKDDTNKVNALNLLSEKAGWSIGQNDTALFYGQKAKLISEKLNFKKGTATAYGNIGIANKNQGNYSIALENYFASLKLKEEIGFKKGIATSYNQIGDVYRYQGDYYEALKNHLNSLKLFQEIDDKEGVASSYSRIGSVNIFLGNYPEALKYYFNSLKIYEGTGNKKNISYVFNNLGNVYERQGNYSESIKYYKEALKIKEELGDKNGIAESYGNIGVIYQNQADFSKIDSDKRDTLYNLALKNHFLALNIFQETGDKGRIAATYNNIGNVYWSQGKYPLISIAKRDSLFNIALKNHFTALKIKEEIGDNRIAVSFNNIGSLLVEQNKSRVGKEWLQKSINLSKLNGDKESLKYAYLYMAKADSALNNYKSAFESHKMYILYRDSLLNEENTKKITQTEMQYEFDKKEAATQAEQDKKDALAFAEIKRKNLQRNASIGGLGLMMLLAIVFFTQRNRISKEKDKSENLLLNILPYETAQELKAKGSADAKLIDHVTVLFTDFKGFTAMAEKLSPQELVADLNVCFSEFDRIMEKYGIEKIKTIGDSYMAAGGLPTPNDTHASDVVKAAFEIAQFIEEGKQRKLAAGLPYFEIRIGIHTGPVVAGIVGIKKFSYDIWGDTVNTASRMESSGEISKVNVSETTFELVKNEFPCEYRGEVEAKGKGMVKMYFVNLNA